MFNTSLTLNFYLMKTRIITFIVSILTIVSLQSCLSLVDTTSQNGGNPQNGQDNQNQTNDYYEINVNNSMWQIHKSKSTIKANTEEGEMDYTISIIAINASNSITEDSKQLKINFNASDLESVKSKNLALSEGFNILYRAEKQLSEEEYFYRDGIMSITDISDDNIKLTFSNLKLESQNSILLENKILTIHGTLKCEMK